MLLLERGVELMHPHHSHPLLNMGGYALNRVHSQFECAQTPLGEILGCPLEHKIVGQGT